MPYLQFEDQIRPLGPGVLTIGCGTEASWRLHGRDLLPVHAMLTVERDGRAMVARGSVQATIVINGVEREDGKGVLSYGDTLRVGGAEFRYLQTARRDGAARGGFLRDTRRGRVYRLSGHAEIGRDPRCEVNIQEPEVSRVHAEVVLADGRYLAQSLGTAYTLRNDHRLTEPEELREGDEITVGRTVLRFTTDVPAGVATAAPRQADARQPAGSRAARMQTVYMGAVEARERVDRSQRRRIGLVVAFVVAVGGIFVLLFAR